MTPLDLFQKEEAFWYLLTKKKIPDGPEQPSRKPTTPPNDPPATPDPEKPTIMPSPDGPDTIPPDTPPRPGYRNNYYA